MTCVKQFLNLLNLLKLEINYINSISGIFIYERQVKTTLKLIRFDRKSIKQWSSVVINVIVQSTSSP